MPVKLTLGPKPQRYVHVGVVEHSSGTNVYVGRNLGVLLEDISTDFVKTWWAEIAGQGGVPDSYEEALALGWTHEKLVSAYFDEDNQQSDFLSWHYEPVVG